MPCQFENIAADLSEQGRSFISSELLRGYLKIASDDVVVITGKSAFDDHVSFYFPLNFSNARMRGKM